MSIGENAVTIYEIEKIIYQLSCEAGREMLKKVLETMDAKLTKERDRKVLRHKGKRKTTLKTMMGEVEFERTVYEYRNDDGKSCNIYLLDKELGLDTVGFVSECLAEKIVELSCELSYRQTARAISETTGQSISQMGAWNVVQTLGEKVDEKERCAAKLVKINESCGREETKLLFEEQDGIYLSLQGKDRKRLGSKHEMKIAIAYKGAVKTGKKRFTLTGKVACANFEGINNFYARKEGVIGSVYNLDEIEMRVLNGDGANWIKRSITDDTVHYQLDTFHRNQAVFRHISDPEARKLIFKLLYSKQIDTLLEVIEAYSNSTEDDSERNNILQLLSYFKNNKDGLVSYKRRGIDLSPPSDNIEYRGCGAMESNVFSIIGRRMKHRRANWSINGGNNLARFLTLKSTGKLSETLKNLTSVVLPSTYEHEIQTILSSAKIPKAVGKGYSGVKQSSIPNTQKWLRNVLSFDSLC
jgi:hypothetical protein